MRTHNPDIGSNFFSSVMLVILALWIYRQIKQRQRLRFEEQEAQRASRAE